MTLSRLALHGPRPRLAAVGAGFALLGLLVLGAGWFALRQNDDDAAAVAALMADGRLTGVQLLLGDAETGQRGYLLTGEEAYLAPYEEAVAALGPALDAIEDDAAAAPARQALVARLRPLVAVKLDELALTVARRRAGDAAGAAAVVRGGHGRETMDRVRAVVAELRAAGAEALEARLDSAGRAEAALRAGLAGSAMLVAVLAGLTLRAMRQQVRATEAANTGLEEEVARRTEALREAEERQRLIIEGARDYAFITVDPRGRIESWSPGAEAVLGWSAGEAVGRDIAMIFTAEDRAGGQPAAELATARTAGIAPDERWHLRRDGGRVFMNGSVHPLYDARGDEAGFLKIARDDTGRQRAAEALRALNEDLEAQVRQRTAALAGSEAAARLLYDRSPVAQHSTDAQGRLVAVSDAWCALVGHPREALLGRTLDGIVAEGSQPALAAAQEALGGAGTIDRVELTLLAADGAPRPVAIAARLERDGDGSRARTYAALTDLRPRLAAEAAAAREAAERERAEAQLRQSQKMEAVGRLTGGIAHDFNNMLQVINGRLGRLRRSHAEGRETAARDLDALQYAAERATTMTRHLLAFARQQPLEVRVVEVNRLVSGTTQILRHSVGETIAVETVLAGGLWPTEIDSNQLENALLNLAVNARDAMPAGGRLTIETANAHLDEAYAAAHEEVRAGQYVLLCVSDTGTGMEPDVVGRVFEPFFTTKPQGQGTGLGLSMVHGFVRQSGGHVKVYSEPGRGTTVRVYLPRHRAGSGAPPDPAAPAALPAPRGRGESVVVVEDEEAVRELAVETLRELGYAVAAAADAASGLALLARTPGATLLFTDVGLPGAMNGRQLADAARAAQPGLRVLFMTGYARNAIVHDGRLDPGVALLPKPFTQEALAAKVRQVLDQSPGAPAGA